MTPASGRARDTVGMNPGPCCVTDYGVHSAGTTWDRLRGDREIEGRLCCCFGLLGARRFLNSSRSWSALLSLHCASTTAAPATTHTPIHPSRRNRLAIWTHFLRPSPTPDIERSRGAAAIARSLSSLEAMLSRKRRPHVLIQKVVTLEQAAVAAFSRKAVVYQWEGSRAPCPSPVFWQGIQALGRDV